MALLWPIIDLRNQLSLFKLKNKLISIFEVLKKSNKKTGFVPILNERSEL